MGAKIGHKVSEETKNKISRSLMGNKCGHGLLGRKHTAEENRKNSLANMGHPFYGLRTASDETKAKLSIINIEHQKKRDTTYKKEHLLKMRKSIKCIRQITNSQQELFSFLKQIFADATLEYPIETATSYKFADIGIPSLKIDFEYDGYYGAHGHNKEKDEQRDLELAKVGWVTFRVNKEILKKLYSQKQAILLQMKDNEA